MWVGPGEEERKGGTVLAQKSGMPKTGHNAHEGGGWRCVCVRTERVPSRWSQEVRTVWRRLLPRLMRDSDDLLTFETSLGSYSFTRVCRMAWRRVQTK